MTFIQLTFCSRGIVQFLHCSVRIHSIDMEPVLVEVDSEGVPSDNQKNWFTRLVIHIQVLCGLKDGKVIFSGDQFDLKPIYGKLIPGKPVFRESNFRGARNYNCWQVKQTEFKWTWYQLNNMCIEQNPNWTYVLIQ